MPLWPRKKAGGQQGRPPTLFPTTKRSAFSMTLPDLNNLLRCLSPQQVSQARQELTGMRARVKTMMLPGALQNHHTFLTITSHEDASAGTDLNQIARRILNPKLTHDSTVRPAHQGALVEPLMRCSPAPPPF